MRNILLAALLIPVMAGLVPAIHVFVSGQAD
jgi:hypothetical protein